MIHLMLDAEANADDPIKALDKAVKKAPAMFASERDDFREIVDSVRLIMTDYFEMDWGDKELRNIRKSGKSAEHEFEVEIDDGILMIGKLDGLATKLSDGSRWLVENKSFSKLPSEDHRWRNAQGSIYDHVVKLLELPKLAGLCWNYIRTKPPSVPKVLKNGDVSQKRLDTLPSALMAFADDRDIKPDVLKRMLSTAKKNRENYFIRVFSPSRPKVVQRVVADMVAEAHIMSEYEKKWRTKTIGRHCEWCEYEPICRAELTGADADFVRKRDYYHKDDEDAPIHIGE